MPPARRARPRGRDGPTCRCRRRHRRRAEAEMPERGAGRLGTMLLVGAVILPALILAADGFIAWRQAWADARTAVGRTADSASEYALRVLEGHKLRLERVNDMLRALSDDDVRA